MAVTIGLPDKLCRLVKAKSALHGLLTVRLFARDEALESAALAVGIRQRLGGIDAFCAAVAALERAL